MPKIYNKKTLCDGQNIYLMGWIKPYEFSKFYREFNQDALLHSWSDQQQAHMAMARAIKFHLPQLAKWLGENNAKTTHWIDPEIFEVYPEADGKGFDWGIGFKPGDPLESWFVVRWS